MEGQKPYRHQEMKKYIINVHGFDMSPDSQIRYDWVCVALGKL